MSLTRYDASEFNGVTDAMRTDFERDGVLVLDKMVGEADCDALVERMAVLANAFDPAEHKTVFSSKSAAHASEDYFLSSGHETRFFLEEDGVDADGNLTVEKEFALNKVGHAMHDTDPVFNRVSRQPRLKALAAGLGLEDALLLQSMYIYKQPKIGGEVLCHQDATYLWTEPQTCLAFWLALEDATEENGCLWGIPGGHKGQAAPKERFQRTQDGGTTTIKLDSSPFQEEQKVALPAPKGTLIAFNGLFPHLSAANTSNKSRHAYTLHMISASAHYPENNWLRRPDHMPLRGF